MLRTSVLLLFVSFISLVPSHGASTTLRCIAGPKSVKPAVKGSAAVFTGEVHDITTGGNYLRVRFRVERFWKGVDAEEVFISTDSTTESPHYHVGEKYLVFAVFYEGKLFTGNCSRTKKIEYAQSDLDQLGEGQTPKPK